MKSIFTREIHFSAFSKRTLCFALLMIVAPNIVFLLLAAFSSTARPLVDLDYFIAALLFTFPYKKIRWLGIFAFLAALLFDVLMFTMQLFPFMDLAGAWYLSKFIFSAPKLYQVLAGMLLVYLLLMPFILKKISGKTNFSSVLLLCSILTIISYFTGHLQYYERDMQKILFGSNNFFYGKSQFSLYRHNQKMSFLQAAETEPVFSPLEFERAANLLERQPASRKILFIVNESWGQPKNEALQNAVLNGLIKESGNFQYFKTGHFPFSGATVEGEMRELCNLKVEGFALQRSPAKHFSDCIPNKLKQQGYKTIALHGASSQMYDRFSWYPKAGFEQFYAAEQLLGKPRCQAFRGVCDSALFENVSKAFSAHDRLFYYWLTLTSHSNYPEEDIFNHRLNCEHYGLPNQTSMCRNFMLQAQFFDGLADLIKRPEMKGVEVLVVGDHPPPTVNLGEIWKYMTQGELAWVHFKIKD